MRRFDRTVALLLCIPLAAGSCMTLRELPRSEYAARPERQRVRIQTGAGLKYEFDYVQVAGDSLTGYRHQDVEGPIDEVKVARFALDDIKVLSVRGIDWYRSGLIGGGVLAAIVAAGLTRAHNSNTGDTSGGRKGLP